MEFAVVGVIAVIGIVAVSALSKKLGVAAPLVLVVLGTVVSLLPGVPAIEVEPEWILAGVLPPLLYSAAVSMPTMDFRRDFKTISGLSVLLVVITSVLLGLLFSWLIPDVNLATGIALGAIVSPTDAVATSIVRKAGAPARLVTILEGESMLNDASALVLLRAAVAALAMTVSFGGVAWDFVFAVAVAVAIGVVVGFANLWVRALIKQSTLNTAISFVVPFIAYLPAEAAGASGLVAVVVTGLITGSAGARYLRPQDRTAEAANWSTIELLLEGGVFVLMGLELKGLLEEVTGASSVWTAVGLGLLACVAALAVRSAFVGSLVGLARRSGRRAEQVRPMLARARDGMAERRAVVTERMEHWQAKTPEEREAAIRALREKARLALSPEGLAAARPALPGPRGDAAADGASVPSGDLTPSGPRVPVMPVEPSEARRVIDVGRPRPFDTCRPAGMKPGGLSGWAMRTVARLTRNSKRRRKQWEKRVLGRSVRPQITIADMERRMDAANSRLVRRIADIDYTLAAPLGWREGAVLVWAGMRGVVTLAAAQSLPDDVASRPVLVLIAFTVAMASLLGQGATLPWLTRRLGLATSGPSIDRDELNQLLADMNSVADDMCADPDLTDSDGKPYDASVVSEALRDCRYGYHPDAPGVPGQELEQVSVEQGPLPAVEDVASEPEPFDEAPERYHELRISIIQAQRDAVLSARREGVYSSATLTKVLRSLDAAQIQLELNVD